MTRIKIPANFFKKLTVVLVGLLVLAGSYFRVFDLYEYQTYDLRCKIRGPRPVSNDVVIIEIAQDTLKALGWPFGRQYYGALIQALGHFRAKAVIFDILFVENKEEDEIVGDAAKEAGNVYFPIALTSPKSVKGELKSSKIEAPLIPFFQAGAKGVGSVNSWADRDGKRRRLPLVMECDGKLIFHVGLKALMNVLKIDENAVKLKPGHGIQLSSDLTIPTDDEGFNIVNYAGKWVTTFKHYSFYQIIYSFQQLQNDEKPDLDLKQFRNKICVVGASALATYDANATPLEEVYPNVGVHANVINSILMKDFIYRLSRWWNLVLLLLLGLWVAYLSSKIKPFHAMLWSIGTLALFTVLAGVLFWVWGLWIDLFYPVAVSILIYAGVTLYRTIYEMRKRELIENELKVASQIQKSFLPEKVPDVPGLEMAVFMRPAKAVGGDLYALMELTGGKAGVMVGDVSGKGTPAALFMAKTVSEFKFSARDRQDPSQVLADLNHSIASESTGGLFVTVCYAVFDKEKSEVIFSNGGHLPLVCVRQSGEPEYLNGDGGMPIGVLDGVEFSNTKTTVSVGDFFAFYSDGISEARNKRKDEYSMERLGKKIQELKNLSVKEVLDKTVHDLEQFIGKADQHDDMTLILVKVK